ncbi:Uncharacterized conserved protein, DUF924 family [Devosia lucknowensis]|uniref:Uncharacterized conserved protein, DUF924 family n=1 Tax=Devosia lucknowensis TaxID=1096929 RepID=A0A1Y6G4Z0_9HYPH|nr:DUF924 family protein [Devosia lucknowensis]SMQ85262.1 Uncharacterized conserved protein, DUF924 family [Devosia lucknowensis]
MKTYQDIIHFWFVEHSYDDWFSGEAAFDSKCRQFEALHAEVARGEAWAWRETPEGRLAELVLLDQFSRQLHRDSPVAFAQDKMALALAQEAVAGGHDMAVEHAWAVFFYMPYMHAESLVVQEEGVRLFEAYGDEKALDFMKAHRDTIARFGRFPFRNAALGRQSTPEELAYMRDQQGRVF